MLLKKALAFILNIVVPGIGFIIIGKAKKGIYTLILAFLLTLIYWRIAVEINLINAKTVFELIAVAFWFVISIVLITDMRKPTTKMNIVSIIAGLLIYGLIFVLVPLNIKTFSLSGNNMDPTIKKGTSVAVDRLYYLVNTIKVGDIITYSGSYPSGKKGYFISRITAIPGDYIDLSNSNSILINGIPIKIFSNEQYDPTIYSFGYFATNTKLKNNEYFVIGDNVNDSYDSRFKGPIKKKDIIGRIRLIYK
jgi:signal peptidase I